MDLHDTSHLDVIEPLTIEIETPVSTKKYTARSLFRRIITLNDVPNQKHHRPIFIIMMSILHVSLYFLTYYRNSSEEIQNFVCNLYSLCTFFVPCMRPAPETIRISIVRCPQSMTNEICSYHDVLKDVCLSFAYPHQFWRMFTVNFFHLSWLHLLSNLLIQIVHGILLERKYGSIRIAIVYWLSGLSASLFLMKTHSTQPVSGASGSLYGLMLFLVIDRLVAMGTNIGHRLLIIIQLGILLLPHIVASIPLAIQYSVAHTAHVGGALVGVLLGIGMLGCPFMRNNEQCNYQTICRGVAFVLLTLYFLIMLFIFFLSDAPVVDIIVYGEAWLLCHPLNYEN